MLCAGKLLLCKSLFLDQNLSQTDSIIPHKFYFVQCLLHWIGGGGSGSGGGKLAVAVVVASVVLVVQKGLHWHHLMGLWQ
jgi:hypothetical protein